MTVKAALGWWRDHLGTTEHPPGSNHTVIWDLYHRLTGAPAYQGCPYCGAGVVCSCRTGGFDAPPNWIGVYAIQAWGEAHRRFHRGSRGVKKGDVLIVGGPGVHTEQARGDARADGSVPVYGTNTSPGAEGSQYNGGTTAEKVRGPGEIYGYVVVHDLLGTGRKVKPHPVDKLPADPQYRSEAKRGALHLWERGPRVEHLQELLGVPSPDGYFGRETARAIGRFKHARDLGGDATTVGPKVLTLLEQHEKPPRKFRTLRRGMKGGAVRKLQHGLIDAGHMAARTDGWRNDDGDFGPVTERAVKALERRRGWNVDGVAGRRVQEVLAG